MNSSFILFTLIVMRMSGAILFNPVFGRSSYPNAAKAALIFVYSLVFYMWTGGTLHRVPVSGLDYGIMLLGEMLIGFVMGFAMQLAFMTLNYAASIVDFSMGLSMAQIYDPSQNAQSTVSSGLFYAFLMLLFFVSDGHLRFLEIVFRTGDLIPFGSFQLQNEVISYILKMFTECIASGLEIAFPIMGIELMIEAALGILMRVIPQISIFVINFQLKIIVGLLMIFFLLNPIADRMNAVLDYAFRSLNHILGIMV